MKNKKENRGGLRKYLPPQVVVQMIVMEEGIAAQSAVIQVSGDSATAVPDITDWQDKGAIGDGTAEF